MILPIATKRIVTPSTLNTNFSPRMIGESIAENMMVKQDVLLMRMMFPKFKAATMNC